MRPAVLLLSGGLDSTTLLAVAQREGYDVHAMTFRYEFLLGRLGMHEHHVGVTPARRVERLPRALRDDTHVDAGLLLEDRKQMFEEPRVFGRGGG